MSDIETYLFHQTPEKLAKDLMQFIPFSQGDRVLEPFKGEGAFYNNIPDICIKDWCEIREGRDYKDYNCDDNRVDWVISNPPFRLNNKNAFWFLLEYYASRVKKGVCFLGNDYCFSTLTPARLDELDKKGFHIIRIVVCNVKKWRGRYFFFILRKKDGSSVYQDFYKSLIPNY